MAIELSFFNSRKIKMVEYDRVKGKEVISIEGASGFVLFTLMLVIYFA